MDKLFAGKAYDGNDIFRYISDDGILPCIKVPKYARVRPKTNYILSNLSVISQRNDLQKWKDDVYTDVSILQIMSAFSNGETERTEVTYGTENTGKTILEFLSRVNKNLDIYADNI